MKATVLLLFGLLMTASAAHAQVKLVEVDTYYDVKHRALVSPFDITKAKIFAKEHPNFLNDGVYSLTGAYPFTSTNEGQVLGQMSSRKQPVVQTESNKNLAGIDTVVVMLEHPPSEPWIDNIGFGKEDLIINPDDLSHGKDYGLSEAGKQQFRGMDTWFAGTCTAVLQNKNVPVVLLATLGGKDLRAFHLGPRLLVLDMRMEKRYFNSAGWRGPPSHILYSLTVRNVAGSTWKKYQQAVLAEVAWREYRGFFEATFRGAFTSLVNQLLNDEHTMQQVRASLARPVDSPMLAQAQARYGQLRFRQEELQTRCAAAKISFDDFSTQMASTSPGLFRSAFGSATSASLADAALSGLSIIEAQHDSRLKAARISDLKVDIQELNTQQEELATMVADLPASSAKEAFVIQLQQEGGLEEMLNKAVVSQAESKKALVTKKSRTAAEINGFTSSTQSLQTGSGVESAAISNGGSTSGSHTACQQQAQIEWTRSAEYRNYKSNPTNANASDTKAKIIELTLQFCGSQLSAQEADALRKSAADERTLANQLRSGR